MKIMIRGLVLAALMFSPACVERNPETDVSITSYVDAITKVRGNVAEIRSDIAEIVYDESLKEAHLQLIDATLTLCDDTLAGKNAGAAPAQPETTTETTTEDAQ